MRSRGKWLAGLAVAFVVALSLAAGEARAWTAIYPPSHWNSSSKVVVLIGKFVGWGSNPYVLYYNANPGDQYYQQCAVAYLPLNSSGHLNDNVTVYGAAGNDAMENDHTGAVTCSGLETVTRTAPGSINLNGYYLDTDGQGGNDQVTGYHGYPSYHWGGAGNDNVVGIMPHVILWGEGGQDNLRSTSGSLAIANRYLYGGADNDCLEDNNNMSSGTLKMYGDCGAGSGDKRSTYGNSTYQVWTSCESTTSGHCGCLPGGHGCGSGSECCSGTCTSFTCTAHF